MYCIRCGKANVPEALFCYNCGTRLVRGGENSSEAGTPSTEAEAVPPTLNIGSQNNSQPFSQAAATPNQPPIAAVQDAPPSTPPPLPSGPTWPGYSPPPGQAPPPGWTPPPYNPEAYRYGIPPQISRVPLAPNGMPMPVFGNPEGFYAYSNKEGQKVYAALAPLSLRLAAVIIDTVLFYLVAVVLVAIVLVATLSPAELDKMNATLRNGNWTDGQQLPGWISLVVESVYLAYVTLMLWLAKGRTLGKRMVGIKVMKLNGAPPDFNTAILRSAFGFSRPLGNVLVPYGDIFYVLSLGLTIMVAVGFSAAIWDKQRRGWHDKLADTIVVRSNELVQGVNY